MAELEAGKCKAKKKSFEPTSEIFHTEGEELGHFGHNLTLREDNQVAPWPEDRMISGDDRLFPPRHRGHDHAFWEFHFGNGLADDGTRLKSLGFDDFGLFTLEQSHGE